MRFENEKTNEKPPVLYHGTTLSEIEEFVPQNKHVRDEKEGKLFFATPDKAFATTFLSPRPDDTWSIRGKYNGIYYIVIADEERFRKGDGGGMLYEFPSDQFECDNTKSMRDAEWHTREKIKPIHVNAYSSTLDAMIKNHVQVYFVDKEIFEKIKESDDHGISMLQNIKSENQKRGESIMES